VVGTIFLKRSNNSTFPKYFGAKYVDEIPVRGRYRLEGSTITNLHYYRTEIFYVVIEKIRVEMNHRFTDSNQKVLACFSCLDATNILSPSSM
jgi:hypothetical protein